MEKQTFKDFLQVLGNALLNAGDQLAQNDLTNPQLDDDQNMDGQDADAIVNPYDWSNNDIKDDTDPYTMNDENLSVAKEYEENDINVKRKDDDEENPDEYADNQQGENNEFDDENQDDTDPDELDQYGNDANEDQERQGNVRYVKDAHLVSRRQTDDGKFDELWIFNTKDQAPRRSDYIISDILKGTDIPANEISSDDGSQDYLIWNVGNIQMVKVRGLPE